MSTPIKFHFHPLGWDNKEFAIEKSERGMKRRYLRGISSGVKIDGHGERMTENCVKSFSDQAKSGDILLYPDIHGIRSTEDIGILCDHDITKGGDWVTEYRLYDNEDNVGSMTIEKGDKLWRQMNGLPPYTRPKQKGFSIEGDIPDGGIVQMSSDNRRVIDAVNLEGVVVVPRPAYKDSVAHACYKALGEESPWQMSKDVMGRLLSQITDVEKSEAYFLRRFQIDDALHKAIYDTMVNDGVNKSNKLNIIFDEYKSLMIDLINKSESTFVEFPDLPIIQRDDKSSIVTKEAIIRSLAHQVELLERSIKLRIK